MTIIPYVKEGCLASNSLYHFYNFADAIVYAYTGLVLKDGTVAEPVETRFRILDTEEDFSIIYKSGTPRFSPEIKFYVDKRKFAILQRYE